MIAKLTDTVRVLTCAYVPVSASAIAVMAMCASAWGDSITLYPIRDNTLYQYTSGSRSNGSGYTIFSGRVGTDGSGRICRALIQFDVSGIPAGSTITSATLTLSLNATSSGPQLHTLHRMLASWGEGGSSNDTGQGAPAQANDATWLHRFYNTTFWAASGGDYVAQASGSTTVGEELTSYTWPSTAGMIADVQFWRGNPATNFGWMVKGNESVVQTVKRFASREVEDNFSKPRLVIEYTLPVPCTTDVTHDGQTSTADLLAVINSWGSCPIPCTQPCYCDVVPDCTVGVPDLLAIINGWGPCD